MRAFFFVLVLLFSFSLFGNIFFDENIPEELRSKITAFYKEKKSSINFLIEMPDENTLSIVAENGFAKTLPINEITAEDVCNLMEEMVAVIYEKDKNYDKIPKDSEKLAKIKNLSSKWQKDEFKESFYAEEKPETEEKPKPIFLKSGIKVTENRFGRSDAPRMGNRYRKCRSYQPAHQVRCPLLLSKRRCYAETGGNQRRCR